MNLVSRVWCELKKYDADIDWQYGKDKKEFSVSIIFNN